MKEINYKEMRFNPFNLIGGEWMLVTAGDENSCNTMTALSVGATGERIPLSGHY